MTGTKPTQANFAERFELPFLEPRPQVHRRADGSVLVRQLHDLIAAPPTVAHLFAERAKAFPDRVLLGEPDGAGGWGTITYGEMLERAARIAAGLHARGLVAGERVIILSGPGIEHAAMMFGVMLAGLVSVSLSPAYALASDRARLANVLERLEPAIVFAADSDAYAAALADAATRGATALAGADLLELERPAPSPDALIGGIDADMVYKLLLTSGSTAIPKAVLQTHGMACASLAFEASLSSHPAGAQPPQVVLDWLPWSHVGGGITILNNVLYAGASLYLDHGRPVAGQFETTIANLKLFPQEVFATMPIGLSMLVDAMDHDPDLRSTFFSRLQYVKSGAAAMPADTIRRFQDHARRAAGRSVPILMGYGTTETHGVLSVTRHSERAGLLGLPKPGVTAKLVPTDGRFELRIKAASVTPGYFRDAEATSAAFDEEGYFRTGDGAVLEDDPIDGLVFTGRLAENFKLATGTWVPAGSLAAAVLDMLAEDVCDCLVVGEGERDARALVWLKRTDEGTRSRIAAGLTALNAGAGGSSKRIAAAFISTRPISAERFERTEKGTLNRSLIIANRTDEVAALYDRVLVPHGETSATIRSA